MQVKAEGSSRISLISIAWTADAADTTQVNIEKRGLERTICDYLPV